MVRVANFSHEDEEIPFSLQAERNFWPLEGEDLPDLSLADLKRLHPAREKLAASQSQRNNASKQQSRQHRADWNSR